MIERIKNYQIHVKQLIKKPYLIFLFHISVSRRNIFTKYKYLNKQKKYAENKQNQSSMESNNNSNNCYSNAVYTKYLKQLCQTAYEFIGYFSNNNG